jgi:uncharacterized protein (AIM24 family)
MQAVILSLAPGDAVRAEAGAMMFMTDAIEMDAKMDGGLLGGLKRKFLAGESFFITHFRAQTGAGKVAFAGPIPTRSSISRSRADSRCSVRRIRFSARSGRSI